ERKRHTARRSLCLSVGIVARGTVVIAKEEVDPKAHFSLPSKPVSVLLDRTLHEVLEGSVRELLHLLVECDGVHREGSSLSRQVVLDEPVLSGLEALLLRRAPELVRKRAEDGRSDGRGRSVRLELSHDHLLG